MITGLSARRRCSFGLSTNTQTIEPSSASRILSNSSKHAKAFAMVWYSTCRGRPRISARLDGKLPASRMHRSIIAWVSTLELCRVMAKGQSDLDLTVGFGASPLLLRTFIVSTSVTFNSYCSPACKLYLAAASFGSLRTTCPPTFAA